MTQEELQEIRQQVEDGYFKNVGYLIYEIERLQNEVQLYMKKFAQYYEVADAYQETIMRHSKALQEVLEYQDDFYDHDNRIIKDLKPYAGTLHSLFKTVSDALKGDETA